MVANAQAIIIVAKTVRDGEPVGASAFLVPLDAAGLEKSAIADTGWLPLGRGVLHLDNVEIPADALLGDEGAAFRQLLGGFDFTRPLLALTGTATAQASIDETVDVSSRTAFGSPLAANEGVSFPLAEHATHLEAARLLCYSALWHRTVERPHTALVAMTKWYGPLHAGQAIRECLLLHGILVIRVSSRSSSGSGTCSPSRLLMARHKSRRSLSPGSSLGGSSFHTRGADLTREAGAPTRQGGCGGRPRARAADRAWGGGRQRASRSWAWRCRAGGRFRRPCQSRPAHFHPGRTPTGTPVGLAPAVGGRGRRSLSRISTTTRRAPHEPRCSQHGWRHSRA